MVYAYNYYLLGLMGEKLGTYNTWKLLMGTFVHQATQETPYQS